MSHSVRTLTPTLARRLAIYRQRLAGPRPPAGSQGIMEIARDLGCIQIDPIAVVARTQYLVPWSRLGVYDPADLDRLLWQEHRLFEYWAHCASIVLTEDYPIHNLRMRRYPGAEGTWAERVRRWIDKNRALRRSILSGIRKYGPLPSRYFEEGGIQTVHWVSTGWTSGRNISRMLDHLWMQGKIMVAGRAGLQKLWDVSERVLPDWTPRERLGEREQVRRAAQKSLRALAVARPNDIRRHFIRGRYPGLEDALEHLAREGLVEAVRVAQNGTEWPGAWYMHAEDISLVEQLSNGEWQPRTTLLSPFDNLICDRARTRLMFDYDYTIEIYTPKEKRRYGYYTLSILHGDRLIGRIDPAMDRKNARLHVHAVHAEPEAPRTAAAGRAVAAAVEELGRFLGAREITYTKQVPAAWKRSLR